MEKVQQQKEQNDKQNLSNGGSMSQMLMNTPLMQQKKAENNAILNSSRTQLKREEHNSMFGGSIQRNNTGLPDNLKSGMEALSGVDLSGVNVHYNSSKPKAVQAHAFAQGNDIHLASGQERHLPHELGHVVQQAQGRVQPTITVGGVAVNDRPSLENEATKMGQNALQMKNDSTKTSNPLSSNRVTQNSKNPLQFTMSDLHKKQNEIKSGSGLYTTVGFEIDLFETAANNPLQGITHLVLAKSSGKCFLDMPYLLETDAGNTLELVTPPYLIKTDGNGVLDKEDLKDVMKDLYSGYSGISIPKGSTLSTAIEAANSKFNIDLAPMLIEKANKPTSEMSKEEKEQHDENRKTKAVMDETSMSNKVNFKEHKKLFTPQNKDNQDKQQKLIIINGKKDFEPQVNIFTTIDNFLKLDEAIPSRLEAKEKEPDYEGSIDEDDILKIKNKFIAGIHLSLKDKKFNSIINKLNEVLIIQEPKRDALLKQIELQKKLFKDPQNLKSTDKSDFENASGDASFVKDMGGIWLKTDIFMFIWKVLNDKEDVANVAIAIEKSMKALKIKETKKFDKGNSGWEERLIRLAKKLKAFTKAKSKKDDPLGFIDMNNEDDQSSNTDTFSLSDKVLGIRHDTMLQEKLVSATTKKLLKKGLIYNKEEKVLVEVRNFWIEEGTKITSKDDNQTIKVKGNDGKKKEISVGDDKINRAVDEFIDRWKGVKGDVGIMDIKDEFTKTAKKDLEKDISSETKENIEKEFKGYIGTLGDEETLSEHNKFMNKYKKLLKDKEDQFKTLEEDNDSFDFSVAEIEEQAALYAQIELEKMTKEEEDSKKKKKSTEKGKKTSESEEYNAISKINDCLITAINKGKAVDNNEALTRIRQNLNANGIGYGKMVIASPVNIKIITDELSIKNTRIVINASSLNLFDVLSDGSVNEYINDYNENLDDPFDVLYIDFGSAHFEFSKKTQVKD